MLLNFTSSGILGMAKRNVATSTYVQEWGTAVRRRNRTAAGQPLLRKPHVGKSKRGVALSMK